MTRRLEPHDLDRLLTELAGAGYRLVGPTIRDGAIVHEQIDGAQDLPTGWTDIQSPGHYRLQRRADERHFGYVVGPQSWKGQLFPSQEQLYSTHGTVGEGFSVHVDAPGGSGAQATAFIGVRSCDLAAIGIQDKVFMGSGYTEPRYAARRAASFLVAVNCLEPGALCFCASTHTGPRASGGFDIVLTELDEYLLADAGSDRGKAVLDQLDLPIAEAQSCTQADRLLEDAAASMGRTLETAGLASVLFANLDHPRWDELAERCLACGNCTQACPTCFCHTVDEIPSLDPQIQARERRWDSCFTANHGHVHGGAVRPRVRERYRQWLVHKLATWESQFGTSGCVGCGRCIAWCPVGIDLTEEVAAIRVDARRGAPLPEPHSYSPVAGDVMVPQPAYVRRVEHETDDAVTLHVEPSGRFEHRHGQFNMLSVPGVGECAISISGTQGSAVLHTVRGVGSASKALAALRPGDAVGLRGPFGRHWPMDEAAGTQLTFIAGGIGLAPLRGAIREALSRPDSYPSVRLLLGSRSPHELLYGEELMAWNREYKHFKASVTVDHATVDWTGHVGVVTSLMRRKTLSPYGTYFMCGPEIMMRFAIDTLLEAGVPPERVWLTMERNMKCAAGLCGRCQFGPHFICRDGPVFRYDEVADLFRESGF